MLYANCLVHSGTNIKRLQSVQNTVAKVALKNRSHLSTGMLLCELHCLPIQSTLNFKLDCITYKQ